MYFTYVLVSDKTGKYYTGSTSDLAKRVKKHNAGGVFWTKRFLPWSLIYTEGYKTLSEARKREKQIKSWKRRKQIENLIKRAAIV